MSVRIINLFERITETINRIFHTLKLLCSLQVFRIVIHTVLLTVADCFHNGCSIAQHFQGVS